ncbi:single-stranded DNA-binding protein [Corynebacterium striatum]|uniref:single-stranded DNA-binding protein n=1 Tax=Corynebacterium striatum TaxID=43770 RepID=UPI0025515328|nr:single-stranded DNA-binding protein [Corynebacterium striatum]MDK8844687.1 single-stranded DNA-binding protein [Corynebacterium striatum]
MANFIAISGNLTKEPELRFTPSGKPVASFTIAHNTRRYNKESQQWEDGATCFIDVELWGGKGENFATEYQQRGKAPVLVLGQLKQDTWEDKNGGGKRSKHKISADDVSFIPRAQGGGQQSSAQQQWDNAAQQGQTATSGAWSQPPQAGQDQPPF